MCPSLALHSSTHCSNDVSVDPVIGFSAGGSEANVASERQRLHGEGGEGHDCQGRGTEASKEEVDTTNDDRVQHRVQIWSGIQCDDQLGNSSPQRSFDSTIISVLSDNSSLAPLCCEHPPEGKDESQTGNCTDDGRRRMKTLSGRLARKLQRSASLVNAGLSKQVQTVLDAATVDRCDFVEICCSDAPCLTEAMQRRGLSSFSALTASETTMQRHVRRYLAGFPRNDLRRLGSHLRSFLIRTIRHAAVSDRDRFSTVFRVCCGSFHQWWSRLLGMACKVHRLVVCRAS